MENVQKVLDYLNKAKIFYVTTVDENVPKCRPFGYAKEYDGKIYFVTGTFKEIYKQLMANPKIEICASTGNTFLRYYGDAVFVDDENISETALNDMPYLRKVYNDETGKKLKAFYIGSGTVEIRSAFDIKESFEL